MSNQRTVLISQPLPLFRNYSFVTPSVSYYNSFSWFILYLKWILFCNDEGNKGMLCQKELITKRGILYSSISRSQRWNRFSSNNRVTFCGLSSLDSISKDFISLFCILLLDIISFIIFFIFICIFLSFN